jgi:hypothetical protein
MRHGWAAPVRPSADTTFRGCMRCGMCRVSRHEDRTDWIEFYEMPSETRVDALDPTSNAVPPCPGPTMTLEISKKITVVCDICGTFEVFDHPVDAAEAKIAAGGWKLNRHAKQPWTHSCRDCALPESSTLDRLMEGL